LERAGACNPWGDRDCESLPIEWEEARDAAPDAIVISWCGVREENYRPDVVRRRPGWIEIPAVRHERIFAVSEAYLGRPGPRLVQGLKTLQKIVATCQLG
jgi:iron complex transport system substrate-binding protein